MLRQNRSIHGSSTSISSYRLPSSSTLSMEAEAAIKVQAAQRGKAARKALGEQAAAAPPAEPPAAAVAAAASDAGIEAAAASDPAPAPVASGAPVASVAAPDPPLSPAVAKAINDAEAAADAAVAAGESAAQSGAGAAAAPVAATGAAAADSAEPPGTAAAATSSNVRAPPSSRRRPATAGTAKPLSKSLPSKAVLGNSARQQQLAKTSSAAKAVNLTDGGGPGSYDPIWQIESVKSPVFSFGRPKDAPPSARQRKQSATTAPFIEASMVEAGAVAGAVIGAVAGASGARLAASLNELDRVKRVLEAKAAEPGPGSHDPKFLKQQRAPSFSFGSARQHGPVSVSMTPGPGRYDPTDIKLTRQPAFKWGGGMDNSPPKFRPSINVPSPGPGESRDEKLISAL